jgi:hypothetical protein
VSAPTRTGPPALPVSDNAFVSLRPGLHRTNPSFQPVVRFRIFEPGWYGTQRSTGSWQIKKASSDDRDDGILVEVNFSTINLALGIARFRETGGLLTTTPEETKLDGYTGLRMEGLAREDAQVRNPLEGFLIPAGERNVAIAARAQGTTIFVYIGATASRFDRMYPKAQRVLNTFRFTWP